MKKIMLLLSALVGIKNGYASPNLEKTVNVKSNSPEKLVKEKVDKNIVEKLKKDGVQVKESPSRDGHVCVVQTER